jgi:hypothetical protein
MAVPLVNLLTLLAKIFTGLKVGARELTGHGNQIRGGRRAEDVAMARRRPPRAAGVGAPGPLRAGFRFLVILISAPLTGKGRKIGSVQGPPEIKPGPIDRHQLPTFPAQGIQYFRGLLGKPPNKYTFIFESGHPAHPLRIYRLRLWSELNQQNPPGITEPDQFDQFSKTKHLPGSSLTRPWSSRRVRRLKTS